jgi:signal transduction histidine kinase
VPGSDEVTAVAGAVEQMRTTLNARNQELHGLLERLKEAQGQLIQQERLASVGQLAGGVAHEINNPLAVVLSNVALLLDTLNESGPAGALDRAELREVLLEVRQATERATAIVRDLRDFAAGGPGASGRIADLDEVVEGVVAALGASFPANVQLQLAKSAPVSVAGTRGAVAQVLQRLLDNARDACARGGTVIVRTAVEGDHAVLAIEDNGVGIAPDLRGRVFEPFFTTKGIGGGTGLGLPACVGIVRQLGGELTLDSTLGKGTVVRVKLLRTS